jgi:hypothetical protein
VLLRSDGDDDERECGDGTEEDTRGWGRARVRTRYKKEDRFDNSRLYLGVVRDVLALYGRPNVIPTGYCERNRISEESSSFSSRN